MSGIGDTTGAVSNLMDLQGLVQNLAQNRRSGVLTVSTAGESRALRFAAGQIVAVTGQRPDVFTRALCWTGVVTRAHINAVVQTLGDQAGPEDLITKLLAERILSREAVLDALDCMIEEEITAILGWRHPHLAFGAALVQPDAFADIQQQLGVSVSAGGALLEGLRRQDELGTVADVTPHPGDSLMREPAAPAARLGEDADLLLADWRDGTVCAALFEHPRIPPFRATITVARLIQAGVLRRSTPAELLVQADAARQAGSLRKALGLYRRCVELGQESARVQLHIAELAERFGEHEVAAQACLAAAAQLGDPAAAAQALTEALRLGADPEQPLSQLVAIRLQLDQSDQAVVCLLELAKLYEKRRDFEAAIQAVGEAQELGADPATVALMLARLHSGQGGLEQAVLQLEVAARAFLETERIDESMAAWRELLRLVPGRCDYAKECADLLVWSGDKDGALAVLRAALRAPSGSPGDDVLLPMYELLARLDPADVGAHDWLAKTYERLRNREGATAQLRLAAGAQEKAGDHGRLVETLERILELDGQQPDILDWLGRARSELGQDGAAAAAWTKAADLTLARGARRDARTLLERAVASLPASAGLRLRLAQVASRDGDRDTAVRQFRAAADLAAGGGETTVARDALVQLARLRPDDVLVRVRLAEAAAALADPEQERILAELVRVATRTHNLGIALDHARLRIGLAAGGAAWEARSELVELLRRTGDHAGEQAEGRSLVDALMEAGENERAADILGRLVASHPRDADLVLQLAEARNGLGDLPEAARLFRQTVVLLQVENRIDDARAVLGSLIQIDDEADAVAVARTWLDARQVVDWDKIRIELAQRRRQERTDGPRKATDRRPGSATLRPTTDRAGTPARRPRAAGEGGSDRDSRLLPRLTVPESDDAPTDRIDPPSRPAAPAEDPPTDRIERRPG